MKTSHSKHMVRTKAKGVKLLTILLKASEKMNL